MSQDPPEFSTSLEGLAPRARLPGRNATKADILVYDLGGETGVVAVKDYGARSFLVRNLIGRWLVRRECRAYGAASGLPGLCRFLGRAGPYALATGWVDAKPIAAKRNEELPAGTFERLEAILESLHERGVAVADLHHRDVLVSEDGRVWVVDLAMAWVAGEKSGPLRRWVFERLRVNDRVSLARMRARSRGEDVAAAVRAVGPGAAAWHARGRRLKSMVGRLRGRRRS